MNHDLTPAVALLALLIASAGPVPAPSAVLDLRPMPTDPPSSGYVGAVVQDAAGDIWGVESLTEGRDRVAGRRGK